MGVAYALATIGFFMLFEFFYKTDYDVAPLAGLVVITAGQTEIGRVITFADVTNSERYRRELERQNERLDMFASMVSHDLRNPLTVAKGHLELLDTEDDDEDLRTVEEALDRMNVFIEDVLQLARQGQPIEETESVDLRSIAERSWEMVASADAELHIIDTEEIDADPDRLRQLFENLLQNAIDHAGTDVTVRVGTLDRRGFYIEDDGPGIPQDKREGVFGSGFTTDEDGTGFGLAIVKGIVDAHGWTIRVTGGRDGGARFEIET